MDATMTARSKGCQSCSQLSIRKGRLGLGPAGPASTRIRDLTRSGCAAASSIAV